MRKILAALLLSVPISFAQSDSVTPSQLVWSIFAVAVIVMLFVLYHTHLEKSRGKKR